jgi:hypothetical protein
MKAVDTIRLPFFYAAVVLIAVVVLIEIGAGFLLNNALGAAKNAASEIRRAVTQASGSPELLTDLREALGEINDDDLNEVAGVDQVPGLGIPYLAAIDGVLLFNLLLVAAGLWLPKQLFARAQGCISCGVSFLAIFAVIALIFVAITSLLVMVAMLLAVPFGTIAYLAIYGFFNTGAAGAVLSLLMLLKIAFVICLVVAQQRFLQNMSLVVLILSSLIGNVVISFLHGFPPRFLVSITDALGAIVVGICGLIWLILLLFGSIPAVINALNLRGA